MNQILIQINENLALILSMIGLVLGIVEKSKKIPFKPITKVLQYISNVCKDEEMHKKMDIMSKSILNLQKRHDEDEMDRLRFEILVFERNLRNLKKSETISQEEFITIFDMIEKYHSLIHKYKKMNSKFEKAQEYIEKKYNIMYLDKD